ncbi:MAG TPA: DinB family protein [Pyrinomonadaceae bacterium]|nr:DinB family protein [Pyrinomonadaceae bacterium]
MLRKVLIELYERDLDKLRTEIQQYSDESDLWKTSGLITNSGGNLCLHLIGNLKHFFGTVLGETGYIRDRDSEFTNKNISKDAILADIDATRHVVLSTLAGLTESDLDKPYPIEVFGQPMTTGYFVTHLATHLNYHLGQINYHRRFLAS